MQRRNNHCQSLTNTETTTTTTERTGTQIMTTETSPFNTCCICDNPFGDGQPEFIESITGDSMCGDCKQAIDWSMISYETAASYLVGFHNARSFTLSNGQHANHVGLNSDFAVPCWEIVCRYTPRVDESGQRRLYVADDEAGAVRVFISWEDEETGEREFQELAEYSPANIVVAFEFAASLQDYDYLGHDVDADPHNITLGEIYEWVESLIRDGRAFHPDDFTETDAGDDGSHGICWAPPMTTAVLSQMARDYRKLITIERVDDFMDLLVKLECE